MNVIVHGGAGGTPDHPTQRQQTVDAASAAAVETDSPTAAVLQAVRHLESAPAFNAGVGSAVQSDGVIRTDAGFMASSGAVGAACSMPGVEHAIDVAHGVATETPHVLLAGERALSFAAAVDVATDRDLWTEKTAERWAEEDPPSGTNEGVPSIDEDHLAWVRERFGGSDTVGAVATDGRKLAAATSTGGRWCALAGRVGDVPQVGAGFYATSTAAASATGAGEDIATFGLARAAVERVEDGVPADRAATEAIAAFEVATASRAGVIVIDDQGDAGSAENTEVMQTASR